MLPSNCCESFMHLLSQLMMVSLRKREKRQEITNCTLGGKKMAREVFHHEVNVAVQCVGYGIISQFQFALMSPL